MPDRWHKLRLIFVRQAKAQRAALARMGDMAKSATRTGLEKLAVSWQKAVALAPPWRAAPAGPAGETLNLDLIRLSMRRPIYACALFSFAMNLLALTVPIYMSQVYDRVLTSYSVETLLMLTLLAAGLLLVFVVLDHLRMTLITRAVLKAEQDIGPALLAAGVQDQLAGRTDASLPLRDLGTLRAFALSPVLTAFFDAPLAPFFVLLIFLIHWGLGLVAFVGAAGMVMLALGNQKATALRIDRASKSTTALLYAADQQMRNADVIQAMGLLPNLAARWCEAQDRTLNEQLSAGAAGAPYYMGTRYLRLLLQVLLLAFGAGLVIGRHITPGMMFATSIIFSRGLQPVEVAVGSWRTLIGARSSYARIGEALKRLGAKAPGMALPEPKGQLSVENVTYFAGPERRPVLRGVSLELAPGDMLAIIGPAASGKTTLARVILGVLAPTTGKVRLEGADIGQWPRAALGRHIGYLPQEVELFPGTIAENIARMGAADSETVVAASKMARVHDLILRLPQGYDTRIMAGGLMLSPGQRQRIALARALYGRPKIVVLDEPNANLDGEGEDALAAALREARALGTTGIVITHRLSALRSTEKVLLLQDGVVQAFGPREEILARLTPSASPQTGTVVPLVQPGIRPGTVP